MTNPRIIRIEAALWRWMDFARRRRRMVIGAWLALAVFGLGVAAARLSVNTDSAGMIAEHTAYRQANLAYREAFPGDRNQVLILVRADSPDATDIVAAALAERLAQRPDIVRSVFAPAVDPHFVENGLLYLDTLELDNLLGRLNRAAPLIERLAADASLRSLFDVLAEGAENVEDYGAALDREALARVYAALAETLERRLDGAPASMPWRAMFVDDPGPLERLVTIEPVLDFSRLRPSDPVVAGVQQEAEAAFADTGVDAEIVITGDPVLRADELRAVSSGIGLAFAVSLAAVSVLLVSAFRSVSMAAGTVATVLVSIAVTSGFAAAVYGALNLVSIAFTVLMVGLGVDFAIHLGLHALADRRRGLSPRAALYRTARDIGAPLSLAAPTTALAFFAFTPTAFVGIAQLGVIAGVGVLVAFAAATSLMPAIIALTPTSTRVERRADADAPQEATPRWRTVAAWAVMGLAAPAALLAPHAAFDADPMSLRDPQSPSVRAFNALVESGAGAPYHLNVLAPSLEAAETRADALSALPVVDETITLASFAPGQQDAKLELLDIVGVGLETALYPVGLSARDAAVTEAEALARLRAALPDGTRAGTEADPEARRLAAALDRLALADAATREAVSGDVFAYWPAQLARLRDQLKARPITIETLPPAILERFRTDDGLHRVEVRPVGDVRQATDREAFVEAVLALEPQTSGPARSVLGAGRAVSLAMVQATALATLAVAFVLWFVLRDAVLTALILAPLILAAALTTATTVLTGLSFNFANVIVIPLLVGIGVDSGVHLALRARAAGGGNAVQHTTTPRAVTYSAFTTIASFGSLMFSPHQGTASMGGLLTIAIGWTLVCTIVVLPVLMDALTPSRQNDLDRSPPQPRRHAAAS